MNDQALDAACEALSRALADVFRAVSETAQEPSPPEPAQPPRLYTYAELEALLGKRTETIRQWAAAGQFGPVVKVGRTTKITQEGLDKFLSDHSGPVQKRAPRTRTRATKPRPLGPQGQPLGI